MDNVEQVEKQSDDSFKQRLVGAVVLISLAVIFLPMIFDKQDDYQTTTQTLVQMPPKPVMSEVPEYKVNEVALPVPEPVIEPDLPPAIPPVNNAAAPQAQTPAKVQATAPARAQTQPKPGIDKNNLPLSWSVQLASGANLKAANQMRDDYRKQGYKAYVRTEGKLHKVLIGPYIRSADAQQDCEKIKQRQNNKQACFVLRYQPAQ